LAIEIFYSSIENVSKRLLTVHGLITPYFSLQQKKKTACKGGFYSTNDAAVKEKRSASCKSPSVFQDKILRKTWNWK
jgi:hypothetical protein